MKITVARTSQSKQFQKRLQQVSKKAVYVGIPASSARDRADTLLSAAEKIASAADARGRNVSKSQGKQYSRLVKSAAQDVSNGELLHIFSKGSPLRNQPARPVLEPAIAADGNKQPIAAELAAASKAVLQGDNGGASQHVKRAGMAGQNAARAWFTDPRNNWAPNAPRTIREKGSDQPGIDTANMRKAITYVVKDDDA